MYNGINISFVSSYFGKLLYLLAQIDLNPYKPTDAFL